MRDPMEVLKPLVVALLLLGSTASAQTGAVRIGGAGAVHPLMLTSADVATMPRTKVTASAHNVESTFEGVTIRELLTRAGVAEGEALRGRPLSTAVVVTGADGYRVVFGM